MDHEAWLKRLDEELSRSYELGFDYAELPLSVFAALPEGTFEKARKLLATAPLPCEALNSLIPSDMKLTGPEVNSQEIEAYLAGAFPRAKALGGQIISFGGGRARSVPDGFAKEIAMEQLEAFLHSCETYAAEQGIVVAIEALNRKECNIVKWVEEALELAARLYLPHMRIVADTYHMHVQREDADILEDALEMGLLAHVHLADKERRLPGVEQVEKGVDFASILRTLKGNGYGGALSLECREISTSEEELVRQSVKYVRQLWKEL